MPVLDFPFPFHSFPVLSMFIKVISFGASIGKRYPFRKIVRFLSADSGRFLLVGKFPKPTAFPLNTYNTTQSNFAEVLREFFLISYYGKVSKMPNKSERKKLQTAKIITLSNLLFSYG